MKVLHALAAFGVLMMAPLSQAAAAPHVRAITDPAANLAQYRTFAFVTPLGTDRQGYQSILSQALKAATQRQMEQRGFVLTDNNPQLLVNFSATLDDKLRVDTAPDPMGGPGFGQFGFPSGYYGYRLGLYAPWPSYQDTTTVTPYQQGTLNVDVVDAARKQLIWEGVVTEAIGNKALTNLGATADAAVVAAFSKFPLRPAPAS